MIRQTRMDAREWTALALGVVLVAAGTAGAQSLSTPGFTNGSNPNELFAGSSSAPSYERETTTEVVASSPSGSFITRFAALVTTDGDGASGAGRTESLFVDYTINFTATAPGAYRLTVDTALRGDLHLVNDGANGASADVGAVTGFLTGGTIIGGGLGLADAGSVSGSSGSFSGIDESNSATIFAVSNGAPVPHTLTFQWSNAATTNSVPGDEAAVRLGATSDVAGETAGDYPGSPARVQADDGHFVTVTIENLCGNSTLDAGPAYAEDCDDGPANGTAASCCTSSCSFKADGSSCNDANVCTLSDVCASGVCVSGGQQTCGLCERCTPSGGCEIGPRAACKLGTLPLKSQLQLNDKPAPDTGDLVAYKWNKGEATTAPDFGDPVTAEPTGDGYALCLFDNADNLLFKSTAPAGGVCGTRPCWKALSITGFSYKDSARTPDGADRIKLKAGLAGKAKVQFKGKGPDLANFGLPYPLPVTAQLQSEGGTCFEATFSTTGLKVNSTTQFKAKAD